jgi:hypothetical protein
LLQAFSFSFVALVALAVHCSVAQALCWLRLRFLQLPKKEMMLLSFYPYDETFDIVKRIYAASKSISEQYYIIICSIFIIHTENAFCLHHLQIPTNLLELSLTAATTKII